MEPTEPALTSTAEDLSPLEQDVLEEYERLAENMKKVHCHSLPENPSTNFPILIFHHHLFLYSSQIAAQFLIWFRLNS